MHRFGGNDCDDLADVYIDDFEGDSFCSTFDAYSLSATQGAVPLNLESRDEGNACSCHHVSQEVDHICPHHRQLLGDSVTRQGQGLPSSLPWTRTQTDGRNIWGPITTQNAEASNMAWSQSAAEMSNMAAAWSAQAENIMGKTAFTEHDLTDDATNPSRSDHTHIPGQVADQVSGFAYLPESGAETASGNTHQPVVTLTESQVHSQHTFQSASALNTWPNKLKQVPPPQHTSANTDESEATPPLPTILKSPATSEMHRDIEDEGADGTDPYSSLDSDRLDSGQFWLMAQKSWILKESATPMESKTSAMRNEAQEPFPYPLSEERQPEEKAPGRLQGDALELGNIQLNELFSGLKLDVEDVVSASQPDNQLSQGHCSGRDSAKLMSLQQPHQPLSTVAGKMRCSDPSSDLRDQEPGLIAGREDILVSEKLEGNLSHKKNSAKMKSLPSLAQNQLEDEADTGEVMVRTEQVKESGPKKEFARPTSCVVTTELCSAPSQFQENIGAGFHTPTSRLNYSLKERAVQRENFLPFSRQLIQGNNVETSSKPAETQIVGTERAEKDPTLASGMTSYRSPRLSDSTSMTDASGKSGCRPCAVREYNSVMVVDSSVTDVRSKDNSRMSVNSGVPDVRPKDNSSVPDVRSKDNSRTSVDSGVPDVRLKDNSGVPDVRPKDNSRMSVDSGVPDVRPKDNSGVPGVRPQDNSRMSVDSGVPDVRPKNSTKVGTLTVDMDVTRPSAFVAVAGTQDRGSSSDQSGTTSRQLSADSSESVSQWDPRSLSQSMGDYSQPPWPIQDQTWTEVDIDKELFVPTSAWEEALDLLSSHHRVLLSGLPGSGKHTLARALLRHFENEGIPCLDVKNFQEWRDHTGGQDEREGVCGQKILLLNHIFGCGVQLADKLNAWHSVFNIMTQYCKQGKVMLVFTFYPHVLGMLRQAVPNCELFSTLCDVRMGSLDREEKTQMLDRHLQRKEKQLMMLAKDESQFHIDHIKDYILQIDNSGEMFPVCCQRFATTVGSYVPVSDNHSEDELNRERFLEDSYKIFSRPISVYKDFFMQLLHEEESLKEKVIAAFCLLLAKVNLTDMQSAKAVENHCRDLGFSVTCSRVSLHEILMKFNTTLVKNDCSEFVNRHAYEGVALAVAQHHINIVLRVVDWKFISSRCIVPYPSNPMRDALKPFVLEIKHTCRPGYEALVDRIARGLENPKEMVLALQNDALGIQQFVREDLQSFYLKRGNGILLKVLCNTVDSVHKAPLLYWSLFSSSGCLPEWIFKTVLKQKGRHHIENLVLSAYACCMFTDKSKLFEMFLKYWEKATSEDVERLLEGSHLKSVALTMPLLESFETFSYDWKKQRKHLQQILKKVPRSGIKISQPPPHLAVLFNNVKVVDLLAEKYPESLSVTDNLGRTALHVAANHGRQEIASRLLQHCNRFVQDHLGNSPLHEACLEGHMEVVRMLMNADPTMANVPNRSGCSPVDLAVASNYPGIAQLLCSKNMSAQ